LENSNHYVLLLLLVVMMMMSPVKRKCRHDFVWIGMMTVL
jgi:hypothetical protein